MILRKALCAPAFRRRTVKRELSLFREKEGALLARGLHFRQEGEELVCAEGAAFEADLPLGVTKLYTTEGHQGLYYAYGNGRLYARTGGGTYPFEVPPKAIFGFLSKEGETSMFALSEDGIFKLEDAALPARVFHGGTCGAVHTDRLFTAKGVTVQWSVPFDPWVWSVGVQEGGHVDLPAFEGEIQDMVSFSDELYLFRERGITRLRALGDALAFRAEPVPCAFGTLLPGTVKSCGDRILFCTESGLYSFNGSACVRLAGCGFEEIDLAKPIEAAACNGKYYAAVCLKDGTRRLWCVSPEENRGHFARFDCYAVSGGDRVLFVERNTLYRLEARGLPLFGRQECTLSTEPSLLGLSPRRRYLDAVAVEGRGEFFLELSSECGKRAASGRAGERIALPSPLRGTSFSLSLRTISENVRIRDLVFEFREETQ